MTSGSLDQSNRIAFGRRSEAFSVDSSRAVSRLAVASFAIFGIFQVRGLGNSIQGYHAFRQTQTAWTIREFLRGGSLIRYETPIGGPPWSIPIELPVYQWICAAVTRIFGTPLEATARAVSAIFGVGCIFLCARVLRSMGRSRNEQLLAAALFACSPAIIFWSHAVLVETCSVFFALWWLERGLHWFFVRKSKLTLLTAILIGGIAASIKITAFAPSVVFFGLVTFPTLWATVRAPMPRSQRVHAIIAQVWGPAVFVGLALSFGAFWTNYADSVKLKNQTVGVQWTSAAHNTWIYGSSDERRSLQMNWLVLKRAFEHSVGIFGCMVVFGAVVGIVGSKFWGRSRSVAAASERDQTGSITDRFTGDTVRWSTIVISGAAVLLATPFVFLKLYWFHAYYMVECTAFIAIALGCCLGVFLKRCRQRLLALTIIGVTISLALVTYVAQYRSSEVANPRFPSAFLSRMAKTDPDDVVAIVDTDLAVSWAIDRRSMLISAFKTPGTVTTHINRVERSGYRVGTVLTATVPPFVGKELLALGFTVEMESTYSVWSRPA
jgi:hypothetical protein